MKWGLLPMNRPVRHDTEHVRRMNSQAARASSRPTATPPLAHRRTDNLHADSGRGAHGGGLGASIAAVSTARFRQCADRFIGPTHRRRAGRVLGVNGCRSVETPSQPLVPSAGRSFGPVYRGTGAIPYASASLLKCRPTGSDSSRMRACSCACNGTHSVSRRAARRPAGNDSRRCAIRCRRASSRSRSRSPT